MTDIITKFEQEYPAIAENFKRLQQEQYQLFATKMLNYGLDNIAVGTDLSDESKKNLSLTGIWFRSNDKMQRLKQLVLLNKDNPLSNESIEDSYKDLSVYSLIALLVKSDNWRK